MSPVERKLAAAVPWAVLALLLWQRSQEGWEGGLSLLGEILLGSITLPLGLALLFIVVALLAALASPSPQASSSSFSSSLEQRGGRGLNSKPEESPAFLQTIEALGKLRFSKTEAVRLTRLAWERGARRTEELVSQALRLRAQASTDRSLTCLQSQPKP